MYINDCSTDKTLELVRDIVGDNERFKIIDNKKNMGAMYNYNYYLDSYMNDDEEIIVHLDGDDWLASDTVLEQLNDFYNKYDC